MQRERNRVPKPPGRRVGGRFEYRRLRDAGAESVVDRPAVADACRGEHSVDGLARSKARLREQPAVDAGIAPKATEFVVAGMGAADAMAEASP